MSASARRIQNATMADLEALPPTWRGEIIDGTLYAFPRPNAAHGIAEGNIVGSVIGPFQDKRGGGPGGWWIIPEPGISINRSPEFAPDVAGWRRERMPKPPSRGSITIVPDWICEVLSPSTRGYDLITKRRFYAELGVKHLWYVEPESRVLTVSRLEGGHWVELGVYGNDEKVRSEPFEAIEIDLSGWWMVTGEMGEEDDSME